jgi:uncharacterized protein (UPF0128 family)
MIDTDKYEGHTEGPWVWSSLNDEELIMFDVERAKPNIILRAKEDDADAQLIADAPLLLAEVNRLQKELRKQTNIVGMISDLVYDGGSHNLTWDELNEILGDVVKE